MNLKTICVFGGASPGADPAYREGAAALGHFLARSGRRVVTGGGKVGMMGAVADAALEAGGEVIGVIPKHLLDYEVGHVGLTKLHVVESMHVRKQMMSDLADGFVVLPGGLGTMEEFFEVWTWGQLGLHRKPYGLLNVRGYFEPLLDFLEHAVTERFLRPEHRAMLLVDDAPEPLLDRMERLEIPLVPKWMERSRV